MDSCAATKEATRRLICLSWMKAVKYDPVALLKIMNVLENPEAASLAIAALQEAGQNPTQLLTEALSDAEIREFQDNLFQATEFSIQELGDSLDGLNAELPLVERLFLARSTVEHLTSEREKDRLLSHLVPDIPSLCQILERYASKLAQTLVLDDTSRVREEQDHLVFVCVQLLKLSTGTTEEGSRRVMVAAMKCMLGHILTPDDLMEGCLEALQKNVDESAFMTHVSEIVSKLADSTTDELLENYTLRILYLLTIAMETACPTQAQVIEFSEYVLPALSSESLLIRKEATGCFGKLGLFANTEIVQLNYMPQLLGIATKDGESMEIRAQAMLALTDWSLLFVNTELDGIFRRQLLDMMLPARNEVTTLCTVAEIAAKLLFAGKVFDSDWLAQLVILFFDDKLESDGDVNEVGNPVRLQQLLTIFFPALCVKSKSGRDAMIGCIESLLDRSVQQKQTKKISKMLDFVIQTVDRSNETVREKKQQKDQSGDAKESDDEEPESSPSLLAAIQVAAFVSTKGSDLGTTFVRALCKMIASINLVVDNELWEHLSVVKELLEELETNVIDDAVALRSLRQISELLVDVELEEEVDDADESDHEELADAFDKIAIEPGGENASTLEENDRNSVGKDSPQGSVAMNEKGRDSVSSVTSRRSTRRLRPSN
jgi:condensin complex subunit 3